MPDPLLRVIGRPRRPSPATAVKESPPVDQLPHPALPAETLVEEEALSSEVAEAGAHANDTIDPHAEEGAASYAVTRSGVVEAVREVLPTQVEASEVVGDETDPDAAATTYVAPSIAVSSLALAAHGYPVPTEAEVAALFDRWNAALQTGEPREVVALYMKDATLLPTLSANFCKDCNDRIGYFTNFLAKRPWGTVTDRRIYRGHGIAVDTGHYTFHLALTGEDVYARYTFTYVWDGTNWMITSHHSSAEPQPASA